MNQLRTEYYIVSYDGTRLERFVFASPLDHITLTERLKTSAEHAAMRHASNRLATTIKYDDLSGTYAIVDPFTGKVYTIPAAVRIVERRIGTKIQRDN